jgi:hypothetical protein
VNKSESYDLSYVTIDSLSEGVGSSQITPLISRLSKSGLKINLISYEKHNPDLELIEYFKTIGVNWNFREFGSTGLMGGLERFNSLRYEIPPSRLIHARSDIPAVAGIYSHQGPVLWDVRSLWADQKIAIQKSRTNDVMYTAYRKLESIAAKKSSGMSTLTEAVIPILEKRNGRLPIHRTVVPTSVDLDRFAFSGVMPFKVKVLFSGTYNEYYDLNLSARFMREFQNSIDCEIHWARPTESDRSQIQVGENRIFASSQLGMSKTIPHYSFGVSICKIDSGPSLSAAMPTKIAEFLACGRPIVVNKGLGDMDRFIQEFNAGIVLDGTASNLVESAAMMVALLSDVETPTRCRALAEKYFSMDVGAKKYLQVYSQVLEG